MKKLPRKKALTETLEIMTNERLMADLRLGFREARAGRLIPWERAKRKLGLGK